MQLALFDTNKEDATVDTNLYKCRCCKEDLPLDSFYSYAQRVFKQESGIEKLSGRGGALYCKSCSSKYHKGKYIAKKTATYKPIEPTACECCKEITEPSKLLLDHDHTTYQFRGWICKSCNSGIGSLGDNIEGLKMAIAYLEKHNERQS
jgi:hypothetical protein